MSVCKCDDNKGEEENLNAGGKLDFDCREKLVAGRLIDPSGPS